MDIAKILSVKFPNTVWLLNGDSYDGLEWLDTSDKPTEKQLADLWPDVDFQSKYAEVEEKRQYAYQQEADPIFFQSQRGKKTEKEWLDKIAEIDARLPYPVKDTPAKGK